MNKTIYLVYQEGITKTASISVFDDKALALRVFEDGVAESKKKWKEDELSIESDREDFKEYFFTDDSNAETWFFKETILGVKNQLWDCGVKRHRD